MKIVIMSCGKERTDAEWTVFLDGGFDVAILLTEGARGCEYLSKIWGREIWCCCTEAEADEILAWLRKDGPADAQETTIYL